MESAGAGCKTAASALGANNDIGLATSAAFHADGKLSALDTAHPGPLQGGLYNFPRNKNRLCCRAVQLELPLARSGLHGSGLHGIQKLLLGCASGYSHCSGNCQ